MGRGRAQDGAGAQRFVYGGTVIAGLATALLGSAATPRDAIPPECAFLEDFGRRATGGKLDRLRDRYTSTSPETVDFTIPGDTATTRMTRRDVWIRGHEITVYEPIGFASAGGWLPSADMMAKGLAQLSDEQLRNTKEVYIVPRAPRRHAVAEYEAGKVLYYPRSGPHPQSDIDWVMQHESGHAYSWGELWKDDPALVPAWQEAARADHRSVTAYGDTGFGEDFAEFTILYSDVAGTACEASARALFPNRFREMNRGFSRGLSVRNPEGVGRPY